MEKKPFLCCAVLIMVSVMSGVVPGGDQPRPFFVVLVDSTPPRKWSTLLDATKNVYQASEQGSRILVFLAKDNKASLRVSTVKDSSVGGYADFCKIVGAMHHQSWPFRSNPVSALTGPVYEHLLRQAAPDDEVMIVIIGEGKFSNQQADKLCDFADYVRSKHHWGVLVTGTTRNTNRRLFTASNRKRILWCPLVEAIDSNSMQDYIDEARALIPDNDYETADESTVEEAGQAEQEPAEDIPPVPEVNEISLLDQPDEPNESDETAEHLPEQMVLPEFTADHNEHEPEVPTDQPIEKSPSSKLRWFSRIPLPASVIAGILVVGVLLLLVITAWRNAKQFQKRLLSPLAGRQQPAKSRVLIVRANGTVYRIGDFRRIGTFHIGSGRQNAVTINDKKVDSRHIRIFKRGSDLFVKNLAGTAVVVAGKELKRHKKSQLVLPAIIGIADSTKIQIFWERAGSNANSNDGGPKNGIANQ